jgi:photosystem II stability/assembly factor-like uncharacterized protein
MRRYLLISLSLLVLVAVGLTQITAQTPSQPSPEAVTVNPVLFKGLEYRLVGHSRGGRVTTVTGVPSRPETFYMGVASGGLFRTTDSGQNWVPITDGKVPVGSSGSIAVADSDPNIIYFGTGSDGVRSNVSTGRGVYKTTDGGATWSFAGLYHAGQIGAVRIHPTNPDIVWVAANGDMFKANDDRGIFKTIDGGRTWKKTLFVSDQVGAMDVELQPGNPDVVYAWMSRLERKPWTIISGSREGGFYKSTDAGETFSKIATGLPAELIGKGNLAVTAANPNRLYALVEALPGGGMYRSDDAGQSWRSLPSPDGMIQRPFYYTTLGADPSNADVAYGGAEGYWKTSDGGMTWQSLRTPHGDNHDIWVNPTNGTIMVQANDGGANVSTDGGQTWTTQTNQPTAEFYGVWLDQDFPYNLYMAQQDGSTYVIPSVGDPFDSSNWRGGPGCETGPIIPHPADPNIIYGSCKGQYSYLNVKTDQEKRYWVGAQSLYGNSGHDLILRFQRVSPMALDPNNPEVLYYGSQKLHRTTDKGVNWETVSDDLTAFPPCCQGASGEPITRDVTGEEFYSTLYAITVSPHDSNVIWTGANDGPFHVTRDGGRNWAAITPPDLPEGGRVAWIDASPHRPGSAYYAVYRYLLGDYAPYIYRTDDFGRTWTRLTDGTNGIPADWPTRVVREDPSRAGLLYAGTEFGMFISFDNGAHWQSFQLNMPNVPINDIRIHQGDLVVATQGRAAWILDNISALAQITPQTSTTDVHMFVPREGYRTRVSPGTLGPTLDYYLPSAPPGAVTIEIHDARGVVVNRYSSDPAAGGRAGRGGRGGRGGGGRGGRGGGGRGGVDPEAAMMAGRTPTFGGPTAISRVTKNAGLNRFVWDVQHENGLPAPPGQYKITLTVAGQAYSQPVNVLVDPRLAEEGITAADLQEQFDHNVRVGELVTAVNQLRTDVDRAAAQAQADPARAKQIASILDRLRADPEIRYSRPGLQDHIRYLSGLTRGVDQKVGRDARERYDVLKKEFDGMRAEFDRMSGG